MINKLNEKIKKTGAPIVVGLDPMLSYLPTHLLDAAVAEKGESLEAVADAIFAYNKAIIDATYDLIPAVKPQIAMYEQFGLPGLAAFKKTVDYCHEKDLVVIGDVKRGDIGSTFVKVCKEEKKGIFVLVKTSNPSSGEFQDRVITDDEGKQRPLYEFVGQMVDKWGSDCMGDDYSYVGAVVGATYPEMGKVLRELMPKSYILVPGYGAQGGKGADLVHFFDKDGLGAIVNSSRGIIAAYKQEQYQAKGITEENFADASRMAVEAMISDIKSALN